MSRHSGSPAVVPSPAKARGHPLGRVSRGKKAAVPNFFFFSFGRRSATETRLCQAGLEPVISSFDSGPIRQAAIRSVTHLVLARAKSLFQSSPGATCCQVGSGAQLATASPENVQCRSVFIQFVDSGSPVTCCQVPGVQPVCDSRPGRIAGKVSPSSAGLSASNVKGFATPAGGFFPTCKPGSKR